MRSADIEDCNITVTNRQLVSALCTHSAGSPSAQAGFMVIVQRNDVNIKRAGQLLVGETLQGEPNGPVTIQVEENRLYHVAIFPKSAEGGVVNSALAYSAGVTTAVMLMEPQPGMFMYHSQIWQLTYSDYFSFPRFNSISFRFNNNSAQ